MEAPENRLANEKSPYLLQHARNPVDWYPWGEEALARARDEDRPLFVSIGYSTCHWCHVMERESFVDEEVARLLNESFVPVKVDREERPDLDAVYMSACQAMTGAGGWPLTVLATAEGVPFFTGTYFPRTDRGGRIGLLTLLGRVRDLWRDRREEILKSADRVSAFLAELPSAGGGGRLGEEDLEEARGRLEARFDRSTGGFGPAPRFPSPHLLMLLLRDARRNGRPASVEMVDRTLEAMRLGGIFDHLGFGFHRYSTDARWLVPHFEKMLYDQAMLLLAYTEGFLVTGREDHAATAREIVEYLLRDLASPEGAFYAAEDADSEGEEGRFYLWTVEEVRELLSPAQADLVEAVFSMREGGNYVEETTGRPTGANILHLQKPLPILAGNLGLSPAELESRLEEARTALLARRAERVRPGLDDKVLADWNGLVIAALARAGSALGEPGWVGAATAAADFVLEKMRDPRGRLLHRYRQGGAGILGFLDDHAAIAWGLVELYEATFENRFLRAALELTDEMIERFWDEDLGGFFQTAHDGEALVARPKEAYDGATPSGNSLAAMNLVRLSRLTGRPRYEVLAERTFRAFAGQVRRVPEGHAFMLQALALALGPSHEVVVAGESGAEDTDALVDVVRTSFFPEAVVLLRPGTNGSPEVAELAPYAAELEPREGRATAYVCHGGTCELPLADPDALRRALVGTAPRR